MPSVRAKAGTRCSAPLCEMEIVVKGMCWAHYARVRRGQPLGGANRVHPGGKKGTAIKYGCRKPTYREHRLAMFEWWLRGEKITPEPTTGCLLWLGEYFPSGYGKLGDQRDPWGGYAHRAVLHFAGVSLLRGSSYQVRHLCDNSACVNVAHLRYGRAWENIVDRDRGRDRETLTPEIAFAVKTALLRGGPADVARAFGLSRRAVYNIKNGRAWRWVTVETIQPARGVA